MESAFLKAVSDFGFILYAIANPSIPDSHDSQVNFAPT
jgi:hypothetical protein